MNSLADPQEACLQSMARVRRTLHTLSGPPDNFALSRAAAAYVGAAQAGSSIQSAFLNYASSSVAVEGRTYRPSISLTEPIEDFFASLPRYRVEVVDRDALRSYFLALLDMLSVAESACLAAFRSLGTIAKLSIGWHRDPEEEDEYPMIWVRAKEYNSEVFDRIREVRREYEGALASSSGWLMVGTDFRVESDV